ncbi:MAG: hypothetical protein HON92_09940 [Planctomycetaceae bacterium]|jgi:hypothetical protein|nr:hypothetical protein [Planctomycetaceae bacterium]MBT4845749.1 hypothetical protein [Planctomycetaceae bacterium]
MKLFTIIVNMKILFIATVVTLLLVSIQVSADKKTYIEVVRPDGIHSGSAGVAMYSNRAHLRAGKTVTFLGRYNASTNDVHLLDPPWLHLTWPRHAHWRIYFLDESDPKNKKYISEYLLPRFTKRIEKLPEIRQYTNSVFDQENTPIAKPKLTLAVIFGDTLPQPFAHLDSSTKVTLYCDNLGNDSLNLQQLFSVRAPLRWGRLTDSKIAMFTVKIVPNRPELSYPQKEKLKIHHFNMNNARIKPIEHQWKEAELDQTFQAILASRKSEIKAICKQNNLTLSVANPVLIRQSWHDNCIVKSALVTTRPRYSRTPVPYATFSVYFDIRTGKTHKMVFAVRMHQDPLD